METKHFIFENIVCVGDIRQAIEDVLNDAMLVRDRVIALNYLGKVSNNRNLRDEDVEETQILNDDIFFTRYDGEEKFVHVEAFVYELKADKSIRCYTYDYYERNIPLP